MVQTRKVTATPNHSAFPVKHHYGSNMGEFDKTAVCKMDIGSYAFRSLKPNTRPYTATKTFINFPHEFQVIFVCYYQPVIVRERTETTHVCSFLRHLDYERDEWAQTSSLSQIINLLYCLLQSWNEIAWHSKIRNGTMYGAWYKLKKTNLFMATTIYTHKTLLSITSAYVKTRAEFHPITATVCCICHNTSLIPSNHSHSVLHMSQQELNSFQSQPQCAAYVTTRAEFHPTITTVCCICHNMNSFPLRNSAPLPASGTEFSTTSCFGDRIQHHFQLL